MLLALEAFIKREKIVSTQQLAREFSLDVQALLPMLQKWVQKGVIGKCNVQSACKSACFRCDKQAVEYYEYINKTASQPSL